MRLYLTENYYIDEDAFNFILKSNSETKDRKTGELTGGRREYVVGYYRHIDEALEAVLRDMRREEMKDFKGNLEAYSKAISKVNDDAVAEIKKCVKVVLGDREKPAGFYEEGELDAHD